MNTNSFVVVGLIRIVTNNRNLQRKGLSLFQENIFISDSNWCKIIRSAIYQISKLFKKNLQNTALLDLCIFTLLQLQVAMFVCVILSPQPNPPPPPPPPSSALWPKEDSAPGVGHQTFVNGFHCFLGKRIFWFRSFKYLLS